MMPENHRASERLGGHVSESVKNRRQTRTHASLWLIPMAAATVTRTVTLVRTMEELGTDASGTGPAAAAAAADAAPRLCQWAALPVLVRVAN